MEKQTIRQFIYDLVAAHLMTQQKVSGVYIGKQFKCLYKDQDGNKCGLGALINPDQYQIELERNGPILWNLDVQRIIEENFYDAKRLDTDELAFLNHLQGIHDSYRIDDEGKSLIKAWKRALVDFAKAYSLIPNKECI